MADKSDESIRAIHWGSTSGGMTFAARKGTPYAFTFTAATAPHYAVLAPTGTGMTQSLAEIVLANINPHFKIEFAPRDDEPES